MKLQERVSTEVVNVDKSNPETKINSVNLFIKLPHNFTGFPPKKILHKLNKPVSLTQRDSYPLLQEKPSLRNFKKEIEELAKLNVSKNSKKPRINHKLPDNPLSKRYALRKIDLFE